MAADTASYFRSLNYAPKRRFGVDLLYGIELNILDNKGTVDLEDELLKKLDYAIVSMHPQTYRPGSRRENTSAFLHAMEHPGVRILGHADDVRYQLDYEALAPPAKEGQVIFEVNEASLTPGNYLGDTRENCREILRCCMKYGLPVLLSSDSHGAAGIGDFPYAEAFLREVSFPETLILNNWISRLKAFLC